MGAIAEYARLVVRVGVDVRAGQDVYISGQIEQAEFLRAIAEDAYRAGARSVDVEFRDPWVRRALVAEGSDEALGFSPPWMVTRMHQAAETGCGRHPRLRRLERRHLRGPRHATPRARPHARGGEGVAEGGDRPRRGVD